MRRIDTKIDPSSENYRSNFKHHKNISDDLGNVLNNVRKMGPSDRIEKHQKRGKLTVRERIDRLKDKDSYFLEFSPLAAYELYDNNIPAAGIITGIITVQGRHCVVVANDATVKDTLSCTLPSKIMIPTRVFSFF